MGQRPHARSARDAQPLFNNATKSRSSARWSPQVDLPAGRSTFSVAATRSGLVISLPARRGPSLDGLFGLLAAGRSEQQFVGCFLGEFDDAQVRFGVKDRRFDEERDQWFVAMAASEFCERGEFGQVDLASDAKGGGERVGAEPCGGEQLQEEVVAVAALADVRCFQPVQ
jgi:hypothetical protein